MQQTSTKPLVMLGIDPGFSVTGYAIIKKSATGTGLLDYGSLRMSAAHSLVERTGQFYTHFLEKITTYEVTHLALETSFLGKNPQTFLKLGYLRGVLYLLASQNRLTLGEFAPTKIKAAVTGHGGADKETVQRMVMQLFPRLVGPGAQQIKNLDTTDAIAICLCGVWEEALKTTFGSLGSKAF